MNLWPIFVPSKGRSDCLKTYKLFEAAGIKPILVVEPLEAEKYVAATGGDGGIMVLPQSNQGIAYVRNHILVSMQGLNKCWYWMLDDDINKIYVQRLGKNIVYNPVEALKEAQSHLLQVPRLAQGALEYQQFSWSAKKAIKLNGYCDVAVAINAQAVGPVRYRPEMNLKEDRDFTLQLLSAGLRTARTSQIGFSAPKNGSNEGGLKDVYQQSGKEIIAVNRMVKEWPGVCTAIQKPDGRYDVKIKWGHFR